MHASPRLSAAGPRRQVAATSSTRRHRPPTLRRLRPRTRGQALVEFALVLPIMILVLLLAIDFGRLFFS